MNQSDEFSAEVVTIGYARMLVGRVPQTGAPGRITRRVVGVHVGHYGSDVVSYSSRVELILTYCI